MRRSVVRGLSRLSRQLHTATSHTLPQSEPATAAITATLASAAAIVALAASPFGATAWAAAADPAAEGPAVPEPLGPSNDSTAQWRIFTDIARDLAREGKHSEAERYLKRALEAAVKGFGERDPHVASACQNLAELYRLQKRYDEAAPLYDRALGILGEAFGHKDVRVAFALHNLAGHYYAQRHWEKAAQYYEQALQVKLASVGPGHSETANTLLHLGEVRWAQGRRGEAIKLLQQALDALEQRGAGDAACARRRARLGEMLVEERQYEAAEPMLRRVFDEAAVEGVGRSPAAESLARALKGAGKLEEARKLLEDSVKRRKAHAGGAVHSATASAVRQLAEVRLAEATHRGKASARPAEVVALQIAAVEAAQEAVDIAEKALAAAMQLAKGKEAGGASGAGGGAESEKGWLARLLPQKQQPAVRLSVLRAVRPEVAALELSSCLCTRAEVSRTLGATAEAEADLQQAVELVAAGWLGDGKAGGSGARLEELRQHAVCRAAAASLALALEVHGEKSSQAVAAKVVSDAHGCKFRA